jgi:hypothetical protein
MSSYLFARDGVHITFSINGQEIYRTQNLALGLAYDPLDQYGIKGTLHKHGDYDRVQHYIETARQSLRQNPDKLCQTMAAELQVIRVHHLPLEEIQQCIECTGYVGKLYEKYFLPRDVLHTEILTYLDTSKS